MAPFSFARAIAEKLTVPVKNNTKASKKNLKDKRVISNPTKSLALEGELTPQITNIQLGTQSDKIKAFCH